MKSPVQSTKMKAGGSSNILVIIYDTWCHSPKDRIHDCHHFQTLYSVSCVAVVAIKSLMPCF